MAITSFRYFRNLHRRGLKRWQVERMFNKKPWYVPMFFGYGTSLGNLSVTCGPIPRE